MPRFQFGPGINFYEMGINRPTVQKLLNTMGPNGKYRISEDTIWFENSNDASKMKEMLMTATKKIAQEQRFFPGVYAAEVMFEIGTIDQAGVWTKQDSGMFDAAEGSLDEIVEIYGKGNFSNNWERWLTGTDIESPGSDDVNYYETGNRTYYTLHIENEETGTLSPEEKDFISDKLGLVNKPPTMATKKTATTYYTLEVLDTINLDADKQFRQIQKIRCDGEQDALDEFYIYMKKDGGQKASEGEPRYVIQVVDSNDEVLIDNGGVDGTVRSQGILEGILENGREDMETRNASLDRTAIRLSSDEAFSNAIYSNPNFKEEGSKKVARESNKGTKFFVSRQQYWPEGTMVVEVAEGGLDYANPDMLSPKYRKLGENEEYYDPREAAEAAIRVAEQWRKDSGEDIGVAIGSTGGFTMPFEPQGEDQIRAEAEKIYDSLPKCDMCGELMEDAEYGDEFGDAHFCSESCAEKNWEEVEKFNREELEEEGSMKTAQERIKGDPLGSAIEGVDESDPNYTAVITWKSTGPGKFAGASGNIGKFVYDLVMNGFGDDAVGNAVDGSGAYDLVTFDKPVKVIDEVSDWEFLGAILFEDTQGSLYLDTFDTVEEAQKDFERICSELETEEGQYKEEEGIEGEGSKKTAQKGRSDQHHLKAPDLTEAVVLVSEWVPNATLGQIEDYVYAALENFVDSHVSDSARWGEWLGDKQTAQNFFEDKYIPEEEGIEGEGSKKTAGVSSQVWDKFERVKEILGADELLDELMRAMSSQEAEENLDFIIRMHDLSSEFGVEEVEEEIEEEGRLEKSSDY